MADFGSYKNHLLALLTIAGHVIYPYHIWQSVLRYKGSAKGQGKWVTQGSHLRLSGMLSGVSYVVVSIGSIIGLASNLKI